MNTRLNIILKEALYLELDKRDSSGEGEEFVSFLCKIVCVADEGKRKPNKCFRKAIAAVVADLLECAAANPKAYRYRAQNPGSFTSEMVGYQAFKRAVNGLNRLGFVDLVPGAKGGGGGSGTATRLRATGKLIDHAKAHGIALDELDSHFAHCGVYADRDPIILRAPKWFDKKGRERQGKKLVLDYTAPGVQARADQVRRINAFLRTFEITPQDDYTMQRIFCHRRDLAPYCQYGGRAYMPYQNMSKANRQALRMNGAPFAEIDISAAFLTIAHVMMDAPFDPTAPDLYDIPGYPRAVVKAYINAGFGNGALHNRWPAEIIERLETPKDKSVKAVKNVANRFPVKALKAAVLNKFPALAVLKERNIKWGNLHFEESEIILEVIEKLMLQGVPALPLHDAILVPDENADTARCLLLEVFVDRLYLTPSLKVIRDQTKLKLAA